jgi:hypothetical protein
VCRYSYQSSGDLIVDPIFLNVLSKYPAKSGCIIRRDGTDSMLSGLDHFLPIFGHNDQFCFSTDVIDLQDDVV